MSKIIIENIFLNEHNIGEVSTHAHTHARARAHTHTYIVWTGVMQILKN